MREADIPAPRAWNSWDSEHPAEMSYLPLGLRVTPCAYARSANSFTRFPAGRGVVLGPRAPDGNRVSLTLAHAGSSLALAYDKLDPVTLRGRWEAQHLAEWGLRFWLVLVLRWTPPGQDQPVEWTYDPQSGELAASAGAHAVVVRGERL